MPVTRNSKTRPASNGAGAPLLVVVVLATLSASAIAFFTYRGNLLYYGDATAHLNIARRILDSRTPGWDQIGTAWLPLPHLLMAPLVRYDGLWRSGLAGSIPSGVCFVVAGLFVFLAARRVFSDGPSAAAACLLLALNPNLLYMQSIAMTEAFFLAALAALLYFTVRYRDGQSLWSALAAGLSTAAGALTRYEGWFVIPFVAVYFLVVSKRRRWAAAILFGAVASLGPLLWLAHNLWYYGNALEFFNGQYSAKGIYEHQLALGMARYPGDHEWGKAWLYFRTAARLCAGWPLVWLAAAGAIAALVKKTYWPLLLLALPPIFYMWSMYSAGTPIFVPQLWPQSYYNARYGLTVLPLLAFAAAALVVAAPASLRRIAATAVVLAGIAGWIAFPRPDGWVCWKESQVNSVSRRAWTEQAASYMRAQAGPGDGVLTSFGDLTGIFQQAGIPLRCTLHDGNEPQWMATLQRPDLFLWDRWAVAISGDRVSTALSRIRRRGPRYDCVKTIAVKGAPVVEIYRRAR